MKYTMSYPHQRHQNLARLLLIIWSFTICSPEAIGSPRKTLAGSPSADLPPINNGWEVVKQPKSSAGPTQKSDVQSDVEASDVQESDLFAAQQSLATVAKILSSKKESQAFLRRVEEVQQDVEEALGGGPTPTSSPTNMPEQPDSAQVPTETQTYADAAQKLQKIAEKLLFIVYKQPKLSNNLSDLKATISSLEKLAERCEQVRWRASMANNLGIALPIVLLCVVAWRTIVPILLGFEDTEKVAWDEKTDTESSKKDKEIVGDLVWRCGVVILAFWGIRFLLTLNEGLARYQLSVEEKAEEAKQVAETCKEETYRLKEKKKKVEQVVETCKEQKQNYRLAEGLCKKPFPLLKIAS